MQTALVLAGLEDRAKKAGASLPESDEWRNYCRQTDLDWKGWETRALPKISTWAGQELRSLNPGGQWVYYPFSGPDFLYASVLFPLAETYVLTGLEPAGEIFWRDDFKGSQFENLLEAVQLQFQNVLGLSFFRRLDLKKAQVTLTTADLLLIVLARAGFEILDASPIYVSKGSRVVPIYPGQAGRTDPRLIHGVRVYFRRPPDQTLKTLYYFRADLSDYGMKKNPEYLQWLRNRPRPVTFLKAASYLLQSDRFSRVRSYILDESATVLQDDSGLAFHEFPSDRWTVTLFGDYVGPIDKFKDYHQEDLKGAFRANAPRVLPFGMGYRFRPNESCLVLATGIAVPPLPPPALSKVTMAGIESPNVIVMSGRPEIEISFSQPVDPVTILPYLRSRGEPRPIPLDLRWDKSRRRAVGVPVIPLSRSGTYNVILCAGAKGGNGLPVMAPEEWPFRVIGLSKGDFEDRTIIIDREDQRVFLCEKDGRIRATYHCATGKYYPTPGTHRVIEKHPRAKSLFDDSSFSHFTVFQKSKIGVNVGFHAMPVFPDGRLAGRLGQPDSHGCVRLSKEAARDIYDWAPLGTKVFVF